MRSSRRRTAIAMTFCLAMNCAPLACRHASAELATDNPATRNPKQVATPSNPASNTGTTPVASAAAPVSDSGPPANLGRGAPDYGSTATCACVEGCGRVKAFALEKTCECGNPCAAEKKPDLGVVSALTKILQVVIWPVVLLVAFWLFTPQVRALLSRFGRSISKFKAGGVEIEFDEESARSVRVSFDESYKEFLAVAHKEYDRQVKIHDLDRKLDQAVRAVRAKCLPPCAISPSCRATVHVDDVVFSGYLYQLLDYSPPAKGRGRRFSHRFGILGRSWRLGESLGEGNALAPPGAPHTQVTVKSLITEWGMTKREAEGTRSRRKSFLCVTLKAQQPGTSTLEVVGMLYVDDEPINAFGDNAAAMTLAIELESDAAVVALANALGSAVAKLREGGAFLELDKDE
jgi:hypothetical protein